MFSLPANLEMPTNCYYCATSLVMQNDCPFCPNYHCWMRTYGRMQKFVDVLDIKGVGELTLQAMCKCGMVKTPADLYTLTKEQYTTLDRVGEKHYQKMKDGLLARKLMSVPQFFAAMDIEGEGTWEAICRVEGLQSVEEILQAAVLYNTALLSHAERVSMEKAASICDEIRLKLNDIFALRSHVQFKQAGTSLLGKVFVITGSLSQPRPKIEQMIKDRGGAVSSSVSAKTTFLVTDDPTSNSGKSKKARDLGIPMINEAKLMEMLV